MNKDVRSVVESESDEKEMTRVAIEAFGWRAKDTGIFIDALLFFEPGTGHMRAAGSVCACIPKRWIRLEKQEASLPIRKQPV